MQTFNVSKYKDLEVKSFALERLRGQDSLDAMARAMPPGIKPGEMTAHQLQTLHKEQLIAMAIVEINGQKVARPFQEWKNYELRTQDFIVMAFDRMNAMSVAESKSFLADNFPENAPSASD